MEPPQDSEDLAESYQKDSFGSVSELLSPESSFSEEFIDTDSNTSPEDLVLIPASVNETHSSNFGTPSNGSLPLLNDLWERWISLISEKFPLMSVPWAEAQPLWVPASAELPAVLCLLFKQNTTHELVMGQVHIVQEFKEFVKSDSLFNFPFQIKLECPVPLAEDLHAPTPSMNQPDTSRSGISSLSEEELLSSEPIIAEIMRRFGGRLVHWKEQKSNTSTYL